MTAEGTCVFCTRSDQGKIGEFVSRNDCIAHVNCLVGALDRFIVCSWVCLCVVIVFCCRVGSEWQ